MYWISGTVICRPVERASCNSSSGNRDSEARAEHAQLFFVELLLLVRDVFAFAGFAQSVALDGLGKNDGGPAFVFHGGFVGCVNLDGIVPAQTHARKLVVGKMLDHLQQARIGAKEVLAEVGAALDEILLVLPVGDFAQTAHQDAIAIVADEVVPVTAPDDFDDVPPGTAEDRFQFLNDLAVAAHRTVQALQVAINNENQIVELLARGQRDRAE